MTTNDSNNVHKGVSRRTVVATAGATLAVASIGTVNAMAQASASTVLITGSNRGIGLEFARQYAAEGWNVIATCRKPESADDLQAVAAENDNVVIEQLDVTDRARLAELADQYKGTPIDVLLNNAGIFTKREGQLFGDLDYGDMTLSMEVNAYAPLFVAQAFIEHVAASEQKKIVTIVSGLGSMALAQRGSGGGMYSYRMSKAAVNMAMTTLAGELAKREIIVGLVGPGMVKTRLLDASGYKGPALTTEESAAGVRGKIAKLTMDDSGRFYNFDDQELPW